MVRQSSAVGLWLLAVVPLAAAECPIDEPVPKNFTFFRQWFGFTNAMEIREGEYNSNGKLLASVTGNLIDWKNPFGYAGANLWDKSGAFWAKSKMSGPLFIENCDGEVIARAEDGTLYNGQEIRYGAYHGSDSWESITLNIDTLDTPPVPLVRLRQDSPCWPFAPFCSRPHALVQGSSWTGGIVSQDTQQTDNTAAAGLNVQLVSNPVQDPRVLYLFAAEEFSDTRWAPFMMLIWLILLVLCCCGCCCGIFCCARNKEQREKLEEELPLKGEMPGQQKRGYFDCCSRRTPMMKRDTVMPTQTHTSMPTMHH